MGAPLGETSRRSVLCDKVVAQAKTSKSEIIVRLRSKAMSDAWPLTIAFAWSSESEGLS